MVKTNFKTEQQKVKELTDKLEEGIKKVFEGENYKAYLTTMSKFHNYSFNNTVLIAMQRPDATVLAGYQSWQKNFNRHVKPGEKGIRILAPVPVREKQEREKLDPQTQEPVLRADGQPETEEVEVVIPRFRAVSVFDLSQTEGDPLPALEVPELMGSVENFAVFMQAVEAVSPMPIRYQDISTGAKGYCSHSSKEIVIQQGMSESQTMKTGIHEVAHAILHDREQMEEMGERKDRMTREVEAESVAYTVCQYFGLDTSDYSFPYIAGWSSSREMGELRASMETIRQTAGDLIDKMTETIHSLQKERESGRTLGEDDLIFKVSLVGEEAERYYLVDNVGRVDFLRILHDYADRAGEYGPRPEPYLKEHGVHLDLWKDTEDPEKNAFMPDFYNVAYADPEQIVDIMELSIISQAEMAMGRAEYGRPLFNEEQRDFILNYADHFDNPGETRALIKEMAEALEEPGQKTVREIMEDAQAEIDALPDASIGLLQMHQSGYHNDSVLPLKLGRALELYCAGLNIYGLNRDGSRTLMNEEADILEHGGIFGVEIREWESFQVMESIRREREAQRQGSDISQDEKSAEAEKGGSGERVFLGESPDYDFYVIYQINEDAVKENYLYRNLDFIKREGIEVRGEDYSFIYGGRLAEGESLDSLYDKFNYAHPEDFKGHSLSVSDVVVTGRGGEVKAYFVDSFGFTELPDFVRQRLQVMEPKEVGLQSPKKYPPVYTYDIDYAGNHGAVDEYLDSRRLNIACKKAIEEAVSNNFDGKTLKDGAAAPVLEEYGEERVSFILANTVQHLSWDGRFSMYNKDWAGKFKIPENFSHGKNMNADYVLDSHPAVLDGFIDMFRREVLEREKELSGGQEKVAFGHGLKPEADQAVEKPGLEDMDDGDEIIDLGEERERVLAEMKELLDGETGKMQDKPAGRVSLKERLAKKRAEVSSQGKEVQKNRENIQK